LGVIPSPETQAVYQHLLELDGLPVTQPLSTPTGGELSLVGRKQEWAALQRAWQLARNRQPYFVLVAGEAGIGKSYLAEELLQWADRQGDATAKTRSYAAEGQLAYSPVIDWLRSEVIRTQTAQMEHIWLVELARLLPELLIEHPDLAPPQPLTDSWQRQRFREALARAFVMRQQPLLLVIDDLQWCDQETLEWLHYLLRFSPQAQLLVVGTVRSEEMDANHALLTLVRNLRQEDKLLELELGPLNQAETAQLVAQIAGCELDDQQAAALYAETEGYPLFVVETIRARKATERTSAATGVPSKIQAVIQSRLEQLSPPTRTLASLAATIGRAFTVEVLAHASEDNEAVLVQGLDELWQRRIIREQGEQAYDFSHDKLREAAQATVSAAHRRLLHRRVAQALEQVHAVNLDAVSGQLAAHYESAGLLEQAVLFYQVYAHAEATSHLNKGLALLHQLPVTPEHLRQELRLQFALAVSLAAVRGISTLEVREAYVRAQALAEQVGDDQERLVAMAGLHISEITRGRIQAAYDLAVQGLALAERIGDPSGLVEAWGRLGTALFHLGQWQASRGYLEQALAQTAYHWDSASVLLWPHHQGITVRRFLAFVLWHLGYPDQAQTEMEGALVWAREVAHPYSLAAAVAWSAWFHLFRREPALAQAQAERARLLCQQHGFHFYRARCLIIKGWVLVQKGRMEAGVAHMQEGLAALLAIDARLEQPTFMGLLAEADSQAGQPAQQLGLLDEALAQVEANSQRYFEAELHRLKGELLWMQGADEQEVEAQFLCALTIAQQQEAKSLELRTAMSLARLWQQQGKCQRAHDLLAAVYGWFTEGFDTPDLQQAKHLLLALS
jgi:predicted ATPase